MTNGTARIEMSQGEEMPTEWSAEDEAKRLKLNESKKTTNGDLLLNGH